MNQFTTSQPTQSITSPCGAAQQRLVAALAEYYEAIDARRPPDRAAFLEKYADIRAELIGYLDSFDLIGAMAPELGDLHTATNIPTEQAPSAMVLGDFRILRELGRGGMGVVYEAEQISLGRRVALKVLPFAAMLDKQQLNRFKNEARAAATLDHPNIVAIYSVGCERGVHYYAMQLVEGQSLAEVIEGIRSEERGARNEAQGASGEERVTVESRGSRVEGETASRPLKGEGRGEGALHSPLPTPNSALDTAPIAHAPTLPTPHSPLHTCTSSLPAFSSRDYYRAVAHLGIQAAEALDHAHQNGILHRDIKPANLLLEGDCPNLRSPRSKMGLSPSPIPDDASHLKLWITDFGLARIEQDAGLTMTGDILGTLRYMSPEQALATRAVVDHRSDIYSLGVTLYELLTLQPAFTGDDRQELLRQLAFEEPRKPRQINTGIPTDLETIVLKASEKNPADRYATAQELGNDLRRFVMDEPISAKTPGHFHQILKWGRRHPAYTWTAALVVLATTLLSATSAVVIGHAYQRENAQRQRAESNEQRARAAARQAELISNFLVTAFRSPTPDVDGRKITIAEILARAATDAQTKLADDPVSQAKLLDTIGWAYSHLGLFSDSVALLQKARDVSIKASGPSDVATIKVTLHLGAAYRDSGSLNESIASLEETLAACRTNFDVADEMTIQCLEYLAQAYQDVRRLDDAIRLFEEATRLDTAKHGSVNHGWSMNLAMAYLDANRNDEAIKLLKDALDNFKQERGLRHAVTAMGMHNLALAYKCSGQLEKAIDLYSSALQLRKEELGADHPETLLTMSALGDAYIAAERYADALPLCEQSVELSKKRLGPEHPNTLMFMKNLGWCYDKAGRVEEAISLYEFSFPLQKAKLGIKHPSTRDTLSNLVHAYFASNDPAHFAKMLRLYDEFITTAGETNVDLANEIAWKLATASSDELRNGPKAVELATRACQITSFKNAALLDTLAAAYAENKDFKSAIKWSEQALALAIAPQQRDAYSKHLTTFKSGMPWREGEPSIRTEPKRESVKP